VIIVGRFTLRLPETLHEELESRAQQEGVSLNQYIVYALTRQVSPAYTIQILSDENVRQQKESFDKLLESLREGTISEAKAFLAERETGELEEGLTEEMVARLEEKIAKKAT
jgi:hypothetical protein